MDHTAVFRRSRRVARPRRASSISLATIKRLESKPGPLDAHTSTVAALTHALETAGIVFIDENGGGPGVRLRKPQRRKKLKY